MKCPSGSCGAPRGSRPRSTPTGRRSTSSRSATTATPGRRNQIAKTFGLAERLGADTTRLQGNDIPAEILRLARRENVTQIVLGQSRAGTLARLLGRSLPDALIAPRRADRSPYRRRDEVGAAERRGSPKLALIRRGWRARSAWRLGSVACAVLVGEALTAALKLPNLSMIFLAAVLFTGMRFGTRAAVIASFLSFVAFNFFFIQPALHLHRRPAAGIVRPVDLPGRAVSDRIDDRTRARPARRRDQERRRSCGRSTIIRASSRARRTPTTCCGRRRRICIPCSAAGSCCWWPRATSSDLRAAWPPDAQLDADRHDRRPLGAAEERAGRLGHRHAAERRVPVPPARRRARADRGLRFRAACARPADFRATTSGPSPRSSTRPRSRSIASCSRARRSNAAAHAGEREGARRAARLPLARPAHAAVGDRRRGDLAARARRQDEPRGADRASLLHRGGDGAPVALRRQPARHVAHRGGRPQGQARSGRRRRRRAGRASSAAARPSPSSR